MFVVWGWVWNVSGFSWVCHWVRATSVPLQDYTTQSPITPPAINKAPPISIPLQQRALYHSLHRCFKPLYFSFQVGEFENECVYKQAFPSVHWVRRSRWWTDVSFTLRPYAWCSHGERKNNGLGVAAKTRLWPISVAELVVNEETRYDGLLKSTSF